MTSKKPPRDSSIHIKGNSTGNVMATGDSNVINANINVGQLPNPNDVAINEEMAALRQLLNTLQNTEQAKINNALSDIDIELEKTEPNRDEVGAALERVVKYAEHADNFLQVYDNIKPHLTRAVAWLGENWYKLLTIGGLSL